MSESAASLWKTFSADKKSCRFTRPEWEITLYRWKPSKRRAPQGTDMKNLWPQRFLSLSLRTHLLLLAFLLALPSVALLIHLIVSQRKDAYNNGLSEAKRMVNNIAFEQYNLTGNTEQLLTILAQLPEVKKRNGPAVNTILSNIIGINQQYDNIVIADPGGTVWASGLPSGKGLLIRERQNVTRDHFSSGGPSVDKASGKTTINFLYPVLSAEDAIEGVISVNFNLGYLNDLLNNSGVSEGSGYSLFGSEGNIISNGPGKYTREENSEDLFLRMKNGPDEDSFISRLRGNDEILAYRKLRLRGEESPYLYILASIPFQEILDKANANELKNLFLLSPCLLVAIILTIHIGNFCFVDRIKRLQEASQSLAAGNLQVRASELVGGGELGELGASFDEMARQIIAREQAIRDSREELDDLYNNAPCGYHSLDKDGVLVRMNGTELSMLGYSREAVVGQIKFLDLVTPNDQKKFEESFSLLKGQGWVNDLELGLVRSDGSILPVSLNATVLYGEDGSFLLTRSTTYDITERKETERKLNELNKNLALRVDEEIGRRLMNERLLARNARLSAIGEMIGAIAHQWRQPLATLGATIQSITMAWEQKCIDGAFLENAEADAQMQLNYMSDTIEDFRNFFSHDKVVEEFDVRERIQEVVLLVAPKFANSGVNLEVVDNSPGCRMYIKGYQNEFKQSVLNLVSNSFDAIMTKTDEGRRPDGTVDYNGLIVISLAVQEDHVVIEVEDNGCGIPDEYADKIFEPYFTTKSADKGSGIGLYMARLIIEESIGGRLNFRSGPDGTVFRIEVPRELSAEENSNA
jgi:PAS domain S-box-containing protein